MSKREKVAWLGCIFGILVAIITLSSRFIFATHNSGIVISPPYLFGAGVDFGLALANAQDRHHPEDLGPSLKSASTAAQYSQAFSAKAIAKFNAATGTLTAVQVGDLVSLADDDLGRLGETRSKLK
jgi:hypothetical protein